MFSQKFDHEDQEDGLMPDFEDDGEIFEVSKFKEAKIVSGHNTGLISQPLLQKSWRL